jgi:hypothetical protein
MATVKSNRRPAKDEVARRGHAMYVRRIRSKLVHEKKGRVVALDIKTGDFEVADKALIAAQRLRSRQPKAEIWLERIGFRAFHRIGTWRLEGPRE